jgi:hypothetical protein
MKSKSFETVIVGGGIAGLQTARLRRRTGSITASGSIAVVERDARFGGRIFTADGINSARYEMGAARYNLSVHQRLHALVSELSLATAPFDYRTCGTDTVEGEIQFLSDLATIQSQSPVSNACSFVEHAELCLGGEGARRFCNQSGYSALANPRLSVANGLKMLGAHPEIGSEDPKECWLTVCEGLGAVIDQMVDELRAAGTQLYSNSLVREIYKTSDGYRVVFYDYLLHEYVEFLANELVIATPFSALPQFQHPWDDIQAISKMLVPVPLFKCFFKMDGSGLVNDVDGKVCFRTLNRLQKVYLDQTTGQILFYCDSENAVYWQNLLTADGYEFLAEVQKALPRCLVGAADCVIDPSSVATKYWANGVFFWEKSCAGIFEPSYELAPNAYMVSDLFTKHPGWIEGSLISVEDAVSRLTES